MRLPHWGCPVVLYILLISFLNPSCNGSKTTAPPKEEPKISKVKFFIETSGSMGGYFNGNTDFVTMLPNLFVDIENKIKTTQGGIAINFIADSIIPYKSSTKDFIRNISTTNIANHKSSQMDKLFEMITGQTDSTSISIFISDCILSYPDSIVKRKPNINVERLDGELKAGIKDAFFKMKNRNISTAVFAFTSSFHGTYYNYKNGHIPIPGNIRRPYYVWVIGEAERVKVFTRQLNDMPGFSPTFSLSFGVHENPVSTYSLLFKTDKIGSWRSVKNGLDDVEFKDGKPIRFAVGVDLSSLPKYARDSAFIKKHGKLEGSTLKGSFHIKSIAAIDKVKMPDREKSMIANATHIIVFEVTEMIEQEGTLSFKLPVVYDSTYENWSTSNDLSKDSLNNRTFGFKSLVDGVKEAYDTKNEFFVDISLTLKKG